MSFNNDVNNTGFTTYIGKLYVGEYHPNKRVVRRSTEDYWNRKKGDNAEIEVWVQEYVIDTGLVRNEYELDPHLDWVDHSPTGFQWGYEGSGPAQLAFAILCDTYDHMYARKHYQAFKQDVIAKFPMHERWELDVLDIQEWSGRPVRQTVVLSNLKGWYKREAQRGK